MVQDEVHPILRLVCAGDQQRYATRSQAVPSSLIYIFEGGEQSVAVALRHLSVYPLTVSYFETIKALSNQTEIPINFDS